MKKHLIFIFLSLIMLGTIGYFYVNNFLLPEKIRFYAEQKGREVLGRRIVLEDVEYHFPEGFVLQNITVYEKNSDEPFVYIRRASFNILLATLLKTKNIIIPGIQIDKPVIRVTRRADGRWNFSDLLQRPKPAQSDTNYTFYLSKLNLNNGQVRFIDRSRKEEFTETFQDVNLTVKLTVDQSAHIGMDAAIPQLASSFDIKGRFDIPTRSIEGQLSFDHLDPNRYVPLVDMDVQLPLKQGTLSAEQLTVSYKNKVFEIAGGLDVKNALIGIGQVKTLSGDLRLSNARLRRTDEKTDVTAQVLMPQARFDLASQQGLSAAVNADIKSFVITKEGLSMLGDVTLESAEFKFGQSSYFKGDLRSLNTGLSVRNNEVDLQGDLHVANADLKWSDQFALKGNISTTNTKIRQALGAWDVRTELEVSSANVKANRHELINGTVRFDNVHFTHRERISEVNAQIKIRGAAVKFNDQYLYQGDPAVAVNLVYDRDKSEPLDYKASLVFTQSFLLNVPYLKDISNIQGKVIASPDNLRLEGIQFSTQNTFLQLSGLVKDFKNPRLDIRASSKSVDIERLSSLFPELLSSTNLKFKGQAAIDTHFKGSINAPEQAVITADARLNNASVQGELLPSAVSEISGDLRYSKDLIVWDDLHARFQGTEYVLNGSLGNFARPALSTRVVTDHLNAYADIRIFKPYLEVISLKGKYFDSAFALTGAVRFPKEGETVFDLKGPLRLDLNDLSAIAPSLKGKIEPWNPKGILTTQELTFRGNLKKWKEWTVAFDAHSPLVQLKDTPFRDFRLQFAYRDRHLEEGKVSAKVYDGDLLLISSADVDAEDIAVALNLSLLKMDLARLRQQRDLQNKTLAGLLSLDLSLNGPVNSPEELTGGGRLQITDGHLWHLKIIQGLSKAMLISEFQNTVFTDAAANFVIKNEKISTENAQLFGRTIDLYGKGWIDFSKNIYFDVAPQFSEIAIAKSESLKKAPTALISQAVKVKITGTVDKPVYTVESSALKVLKDTTGIIKDGIGGILEEIFK